MRLRVGCLEERELLSAPPGLPDVPQHYSWIRIAELAYSGNPMGGFEDQLLQNGVDLVVPNAAYLQHIHSAAAATPQFVYSNVSNVYLSLLTDWLNYADQHGYSREDAFYHAAQALAWSGDSPSSQPVTWFWAAFLAANGTFTDRTSQAHGSGSGGVTFGSAADQAVYLGYTDPFMEINVALTSAAAGGWSGVLEYPTAVDSNGSPTSWAPLTLYGDTTNGLSQSGKITFDAPVSTWVPASINGSARLFYVRYRTTSGGTAPVASTILGQDYVNANGGTSGTIPAFDSSADLNHDGYLDNTEYANRRSGFDARFVYQSRVFVPYYGQMRFLTNPSTASFRAWAADYSARVLSSVPLASGLFEDNSVGYVQVNPATILESTATYGVDYGTMLQAINQAISPRWVLANVGGGGTHANPIMQDTGAYYDEFALRPLADSWSTFQGMAAQVAQWTSLTSPAPYGVLDTYPTGGSSTDSRTQIATLAYYYLVGVRPVNRVLGTVSASTAPVILAGVSTAGAAI